MTQSLDPLTARPTRGVRARVDSHELRDLCDGWQAASTPPDRYAHPADLDGLDWHPARVPGTAADVLRDAGLWRSGEPCDLDREDWWFRTSFEADSAVAGEQVVLDLHGIATVAEVYLNGELLLEGDSMFERTSLDVGERLRAVNELTIRCRALAPLLEPRRRPRARWRTRLVADGNLRFFRTALLGRAPGFAAGPAAVGPWRPVQLTGRRELTVEQLALRTRMEGDDGVLAVQATVRVLDGDARERVELELSGPSGIHRVALGCDADGDGGRDELRIHGELRVPEVARWWPHTHGDCSLHDVRLIVDGERPTGIAAGRVGFRELAFGADGEHELERDGLDIHVNGVRVFARGAVWSAVDALGLAPSRGDLREQLSRVREAGMNMLRLPGTGVYESADFYELCDELGILVWQDFMFANLDYPTGEERFRATVEREVAAVLDELGGRPCLTVLCGNSEVEQQVAMQGLDPTIGRGEFFGERLPRLIEQSGVDAAYVPSAPCGGDLPFRPDRGVANYYGVGGYRRPLSDARLADVRFAAECLAFSNVPDDAALERMLPDTPAALVVHHPVWKAGVPRDVGAGWDFEDVRDHYLTLLFGVDPSELRRTDHERYLELSRAVTGEVMAEVFGEWRRRGSRCGGGLVLWLRDVVAGAGWGVIDYDGQPKAAYHHLRRALAPVAVWTTDEGLGGVEAHVANDRAVPLAARLRVALYRNLEQRVGEAVEPLELPAHSSRDYDVEDLLGYFVDASWAYRFGPPEQDAIVVSLEREVDEGCERRQLLSQSVRFPAARPTARETAERLGLGASAEPLANGDVRLLVGSRRLAYGVGVHVPGFRPDDDRFCVEPGAQRSVLLRPCLSGASFDGGSLTALNLEGRVRLTGPKEVLA
jgi:beta-mannosidase